jgi:lipid-A-disaccharide synthase
MAQSAGVEPIVHYRNMAFMGFVNVLLNIDKIFRVQRLAERELISFSPDKVILIDYPGFNLRFAKFVKHNLPSAEVDYYIAPKLWAWKEYRLKAIKRYVDRMFTIFPFETEWFGSRGYKVEYVGNPSVDSVTAFMNEIFDEKKFRADNNFDSRPIVALLAGSRRQEIRSCLPIMVQLAENYSEYQFVVAAASSVEAEFYESIVGQTGVKIIYGATYPLLRVARAAVVNSGTATLETALFRVPQVVVYKVFGGRLTMLLKPLLIKTPWVSLVNIIAQREVVTELLAHNYTLNRTDAEFRTILSDGNRRQHILHSYDQIIRTLGPAGADARCAEKILKYPLSK